MCQPEGRQSPGALFANWREYDGSFLEKSRLALRNAWIKVRTHSNCCGNGGEPGC